ncbi:MAG: TVP38/TMEM64 family protein [Pseudomonadota bacterium]|nr:TVP38/TMEM64 family protein [Pseudomonadota bacterium]
MSDSKSSSVSPWQWALGVVVLAALVAGWLLLPIKEWSDAFQAWIKHLGPWGWVIFAGVYIVGTVLLLPVSVLTIVAGLAFGLAIGFPLVVVSATIGATLAFLVARYLAHDKVDSLMQKRPKFKAIQSAVSEGGWKVVGLLRLSPVLPFNLQNYFYGITDLKLVEYVLATFFGIMPGTLLYVYLGAAGKAASGDGGGALKWTFFGIGLVATVVVAVFVTKKAKAKLKEHGVGQEGSKSGKGSSGAGATPQKA